MSTTGSSLTSVGPDLEVFVTTAIDEVIARIDEDRSEGRRYLVPH